ncbi:MAG: MFS transporter [Nanoarchaeota archaeon]
MLKSKRALPVAGAGFIVLVSFIYSLAGTIAIPVYPIFIKNLFNNPAYAGYFLSFVYFMIFSFILLSIYFLKKFDRWTLMKYSILLSGLSYFVLSLVTSVKELVILEIFRTMAVAVNFVVTGLLIRDHSTRKNISKNEGFYFAIINISFFIGPIIGGYLADAYSISKVFMISSIFPLALFLFLVTKKNPREEVDGVYTNIFSNIKDYFRNKDLALNYITAAGLLSWLTILYVYIPLFMYQNGLNEKTIGIFLACTVIPLIIFEIPITKLRRYVGYRKLFFTGFLLIGLFGAATFFFSDIYIKLLFFILTNLGIAAVEPLKESYFFEVIRKKSDETRFYPIFKTSSDIGHLTGPLIFSTVLLFSNFNVMFLVASIIMIGYGILSLFLKEIK